MMPAGLGEHLAVQSGQAFAHLFERLNVIARRHTARAGRGCGTDIGFVRTGMLK